jgi:Zn-dependent protease
VTRQAEKQSAGSKAGWVAIMAAKAGKIFAALKSVVVLKPFLTLITAFGSVFAYSFLLGWEFSAGFVGMIFIHELGHVGAAKLRGFKTSAPVFIPFLGALIMMADMGDRDDEAYVGIGGPLIGGLAALGLLVPVLLLKNPPAILVGLCYTALFINLFNLIPVRPLDGGRILQATGKASRYLAAAGVIALPFLFHSVFFLFIWILALGHLKIPPKARLAVGLLIQSVMLGLELAHVWGSGLFALVFSQLYASFGNWLNSRQTTERTATDDNRPQLEVSRRWIWAGCYAVLAITLGVAMVIAHHHLPPASTK